jgi:hypothetical protein
MIYIDTFTDKYICTYTDTDAMTIRHILRHIYNSTHTDIDAMTHRQTHTLLHTYIDVMIHIPIKNYTLRDIDATALRYTRTRIQLNIYGRMCNETTHTQTHLQLHTYRHSCNFTQTHT